MSTCVEKIDAFTKLQFGEPVPKTFAGRGAISYVEVPDMQDNLEAVISVLQFIYDNIMYAELNTKSDYRWECGYDGEIRIVEEDGKLVWECPNCKEPRSEQDECGKAGTCGHNRDTVLESGPHQGGIRDRGAAFIGGNHELCQY